MWLQTKGFYKQCCWHRATPGHQPLKELTFIDLCVGMGKPQAGRSGLFNLLAVSLGNIQHAGTVLCAAQRLEKHKTLVLLSDFQQVPQSLCASLTYSGQRLQGLLFPSPDK